MTGSVEVLVVGAGISGLTHAHALGSDADVRVLEQSRHVGGQIRTERVAEVSGLRFEDGPEALSGASRDVLGLAAGLGVAVQEVPREARRRYVVRRSRLVEVPLSPPALLRTSLLSMRGKLRLFTEGWRARDRALDGSIADFVRHRLGREVLEALVDPMVSGIHAGDPEALSVRACFPEVVRWVEEHGSLFAALKKRSGTRPPGPELWKPRGGMQMLPDALARELDDRLILGTPVRSLARHSEGWIARTETGEWRATRVVLALSLRATVRLLASVSPQAASALAGMTSESIVSVAHAYPRERIAHPLDGFGYLVPSREEAVHLGTLFSSSIDPDCASEPLVLLRTLFGGARRPELVTMPDAELLQAVVREVHPLLGISSAPAWHCVRRHEGALPRFDLAHATRLATLERALPPGLSVLGNFMRGIGVPALVTAARALAERSAAPVASSV